MTAEEIAAILKPFLRPARHPSAPPSPQDWDLLRNKFQCDFHPDFITFYEVVWKYQFMGELLDATQPTPPKTADTITFVYDHEFSHGRWPTEMIPFQAVGNGDYFCLNALLGADSPVCYVYHEDSSVEEVYSSFAAWIEDLPEFWKD